MAVLQQYSDILNVTQKTDSHVETSALDQSSGGLTKIFVSISLALLVVALAGVIYWCLCLKAKPKGQKYGVEIILKVVGQSVTLNTDTEVQTDDHIKWMFGDKKSLIAQTKEGTGEITVYNDEEEDDDRFIDRLELNHQTGSLTIRNSRTTDSGHYHLQINRSGKTSFKRFSVTVSDSPETRIIMLYDSEITENKMPLMEKLPTTSA
ncbi:uncharacterized protein LOC131531099 [Onychostoma macrolepis]|uniref:uncharacterized protein LOC131531099 n=1 Tax=Onychostoma macrolepis TaxID=369639 RepID=UPI00272D1E4B|nr:uncharacterized protein LOC131531099 [Onychostoma macrolepis]